MTKATINISTPRRAITDAARKAIAAANAVRRLVDRPAQVVSDKALNRAISQQEKAAWALTSLRATSDAERAAKAAAYILWVDLRVDGTLASPSLGDHLAWSIASDLAPEAAERRVREGALCTTAVLTKVSALRTFRMSLGPAWALAVMAEHGVNHFHELSEEVLDKLLAAFGHGESDIAAI